MRRRDDAILSLATVFTAAVGGTLFTGRILTGVVLLLTLGPLNALVWRNGKARALRCAMVAADVLIFCVSLLLVTYHVRDYLARPCIGDVLSRSVATNADGQTRVVDADGLEYRQAPVALTSSDSPAAIVVLLHGNGGDWAEIITDTRWDRIVEERGWLLLAPVAPGHTWDERTDRAVLTALTDAVARLGSDRPPVLLTGRSDGASWTYRVGLRYHHVFRAIAPCAGSLWNLAPLHVFNSHALPVYIYHGAKDPIFPVEEARAAAQLLRHSGHDVVYHESADGGHSYTPEEAERVAAWFAEVIAGDSGRP